MSPRLPVGGVYSTFRAATPCEEIRGLLGMMRSALPWELPTGGVPQPSDGWQTCEEQRIAIGETRRRSWLLTETSCARENIEVRNRSNESNQWIETVNTRTRHLHFAITLYTTHIRWLSKLVWKVTTSICRFEFQLPLLLGFLCWDNFNMVFISLYNVYNRLIIDYIS